MKIAEGFSLLPGIEIGWYVWKQKRHYYVTFHWLVWYCSSLKEFAWEEEGGEK